MICRKVSYYGKSTQLTTTKMNTKVHLDLCAPFVLLYTLSQKKAFFLNQKFNRLSRSQPANLNALKCSKMELEKTFEPILNTLDNILTQFDFSSVSQANFPECLHEFELRTEVVMKKSQRDIT